MFEISSDIIVPVTDREKALKRALELYLNSDQNKQQSAQKVVDEFGVWNGISRRSAIDYLRQRLPEKTIQRQ
jgi:hypothetical protein